MNSEGHKALQPLPAHNTPNRWHFRASSKNEHELAKPRAFIPPSELALNQGKHTSIFSLVSSMVASAGESCLSSTSVLLFNLDLAL